MTKFIPQRKNANKHTLHGTRLLEKSITTDGFIDAQTAAADGEIISGSARLELSAEKFADVEPIIVESDGTRPVIVVRTDIPNADDPRARRLSIAANQIGATDWNPSGDLLKEWAEQDASIREMFADSEWNRITELKEKYTGKVESPAYVPTGEKPEINKLYDNTKTLKLIENIEQSAAPNEVKDFLKIAAQRHTVLNFAKIADFYASSEKDIQALMEESALVIIDFNKAIENGYVELTEKINELLGADYSDE